MGPDGWGNRGGAWLLPLMKTETSGLSLFQLLWNPSPGSKKHRLLLNPLEMGAGEGEESWDFGKVEGLVPGLPVGKVSTLGTLRCSPLAAHSLPDNRADYWQNNQRGEATSPGSHS